MYYGVPCHGYALNCHLVYLAIPGTIPLCTKKQNLFVLFICNQKSEIQNCSNKHETGLVLGIFHAFFVICRFFFFLINFFENSLESQTARTLIRPDALSGLIWV